MTATEFTYRKTAAEGSDGVALLIALYDTLAGDLRRAADAERRKDIEGRCKECNHALLVIGHLQDWVERSSGGDLSQQLIELYRTLRRAIMRAQVEHSATLLDEQMNLVLSVRGAWQRVELQEREMPNSDASGVLVQPHLCAPTSDQGCTSSWSA